MTILPFRFGIVVDPDKTAQALHEIEVGVTKRVRRWKLRRAMYHRAGLGLAIGTSITIGMAWAVFSVLLYLALQRWF